MRKLFLILFSLGLFITVKAQEEGEIQLCLDAAEAYEIGHFDETIDMLTPRVTTLSSRPKITALRLLALCYLEKDQVKLAENYVSQLLKEDPYFNTGISDPLRFVDMVDRLKRGGEATIITASQQAESLSEAPVPVTLITEEMIRNSGARHLKDLLLMYVPGMTAINGVEDNIAMHGVYSNFQEKMLIMLDGHRLNSRATNAETVDYRTSLDKIKQIEVLRGPASSLYGNVALTAVVNIITKDGRDVDGVKVGAGAGNYHSYRGDFLFGKRVLDVNFMGWASVYSSDGEKLWVDVDDPYFYGKVLEPKYMYIDAYNHRPAYDIGFSAEWKDLKLTFTMQEAKKVIPYNSVLYLGLYDYDKYRKYNGVTPGHSRQTIRTDLTYDRQWNEHWYAKFNAFIDFENCTNYDVGGDSLLPADRYLPVPPGEAIPGGLMTDMFDYGIYQIQTWRDYTYGVNAQANYTFDYGRWNHSLLFGLQFENYTMQDNSVLVGDHFDRILVTFSEKNRSILMGNELNLSPFVQYKTIWNDRFIFNGGLRFDAKHRYDGQWLTVLSPRLSFIYKLNRGASVKLGYSHSFVDAPFFYRGSTIATYDGGKDLKPETMDAVQLTYEGNVKNNLLSYQSNVFYNRLSDLIFPDRSEGKVEYRNAGSLDVVGFEQTLSSIYHRHSASLNFTYQRLVHNQNYSADDSHIYHVPDFIFNAMYRYQFMENKRYGRLSAQANVNVVSKQLSPLTNVTLYRGDEQIMAPDNELPARAVVNMGLDYDWRQMSIGLNAYNLLNHRYELGGSMLVPLPQQGFSFMATLAYHFK